MEYKLEESPFGKMPWNENDEEISVTLLGNQIGVAKGWAHWSNWSVLAFEYEPTDEARNSLFMYTKFDPKEKYHLGLDFGKGEMVIMRANNNNPVIEGPIYNIPKFFIGMMPTETYFETEKPKYLN